MKIFFDFDGTLINSKKRLYELFQYLVPKSELSFDDYWDLKRDQVKHLHILEQFFSLSNNEIGKFQERWFENIEKKIWLSFDKPCEGVHQLLNQLRELNFELFLITNRMSSKNVFFQLNQFELEDFFDEVLVTEQKTKKQNKILSMNNNLDNSFIVGDTVEDIEVGKLLKMKTIAISNGFTSKKHLTLKNPDCIVENIADMDIRNLI